MAENGFGSEESADLSRFAGSDIGEAGMGAMDGAFETGDRGEMSESLEEKSEEKARENDEQQEAEGVKTEEEDVDRPAEIPQPLWDVLRELKIDVNKHAALVRAIKEDLDRHPELSQQENARQEMLKLVAVHLWKEMLKLMGASEQVPQLENAQIIKNLKERYQKKMLLDDEERLLGQLSQERILPVVLGRMLRQTVTTDGGQLDFGAWRGLMTAYQENVDGAKMNQLNELMRLLLETVKKVEEN